MIHKFRNVIIKHYKKGTNPVITAEFVEEGNVPKNTFSDRINTMNYKNIQAGKFLSRPNRFIALVEINEKVETCHVKNTGRCRELLIPGATVFVQKADNQSRKTKYSVIGVIKEKRFINMDSQAPNQVVYEALLGGEIKELPALISAKREVTFGHSRFDVCVETIEGTEWIEVKGVTLEENGIAMFPDAPTKRGTKHINGLVDAVKKGDKGTIFFLIQLKGIDYFTPNKKMDPDFAAALSNATAEGVKILCYDSIVTEMGLEIGEPVPMKL